MESKYVFPHPPGSSTKFRYQPDGYLTEERKAADPDQGFSTFFSETGEHQQSSRYILLTELFFKATANMSLVPSTPISSPMSSTKSAPAHIEACSTQSR